MCVTEQFLYACPDVPCIHKQTQFLGPEFWSFLKKEISLLSRHGLTPIYLAEGPCFPIESFQSTGHFSFLGIYAVFAPMIYLTRMQIFAN